MIMTFNIKGGCMKIGLFYATNTGYTEEVAEELCQHFGTSLIDTCQNIEDLELDDLQATMCFAWHCNLGCG